MEFTYPYIHTSLDLKNHSENVFKHRIPHAIANHHKDIQRGRL